MNKKEIGAKRDSEPRAAHTTQLPITTFKNFGAKTREELKDLRSLLEKPKVMKLKKQLPWVKLARFGDMINPNNPDAGCLRHDGNVLAVTGVELDYDAGEYTFEKVVQKLTEAGLWAFVVTSPSYTPDFPKWRVYAFFSREFSAKSHTMKAYRKVGVERIEGVLGVKVAPESYKLSQSYYYGQVKGNEYQFEEIPGKCIDELYGMDLDAIALTNVATVKEPMDIEESIRQIQTGENIHENLTKLSCKYASFGMEEGAILSSLNALVETSNRDAATVASRLEEMPGLVRSAVEKVGSPIVETEVRINPGWPDTPMTSRPRLYGNHLLQGYLTMLNGPGGVAKSVFTVGMAIGLAIGRDLLKLAPGYDLKPRQVLMLNNEDCENELQLRLNATMQCHKLTDEERARARKNLQPQSGYLKRIKLAAETETGGLAKTNLVEEIITYCHAHNIEAIYFDPLVSLHDSNENDNTVMEAVVAIMREIAGGAEVGIYFCHHSRKGGNAETVDENARGASALVNAVRASYGLRGMSAKEVAQFSDIDPADRGGFVRLDSGKSNYAARATDATWFELQSVQVQVKDWETGVETEESVGVPVPVTLRVVEAALKSSWTLLKLMSAIREAGLESPLTLTGKSGEFLSTALSNDENPVGRTVLHDRFQFFPALGDEPREVQLLDERLRCWQTRGENNKRVFHYEIVG